jgi:ribonuclease P protein component
LYFLKNTLSYSRFAISISGKVGNSVQRNFMKRRMKDLFRYSQQQLLQPYDLWISVKKSFTRADAAKIESLFRAALDKINSHP